MILYTLVLITTRIVFQLLSIYVVKAFFVQVVTSIGPTQQTFALEPSSRTAVLGDTIILPCRVLHKVGTLQWTKDGFGLGTERDLTGFPRIRMVGSDEEGDFSLQITNVSLDDDATYQCQVGAAQGVKGIRSESATLVVYVPPSAPRILEGSKIRSKAGQKTQLTCVSNGGRPATELTWLDEMGRVVEENIEYTTTLLPDGKRADSSLLWTLILGSHHDGKTLACRAENPALKHPLATTGTLEVLYQPQTVLRASKFPVLEFEDISFSCDVEANPGVFQIKWFKNDEPLTEESFKLSISRVTREMNHDNFTCEATNEIGKNRSSISLDVHYAPTVRVPSETLVADLGQKVYLRCFVDGNPEPRVVWVFQSTGELIGTGEETVILLNTSRQAGQYTCTAKSSGFVELSSNLWLFIRGPPKIHGPSIQYGIKGKEVKLHCVIMSFPEATGMNWEKDSTLLDINITNKYRIDREVLPTSWKYFLTIKDVTAQDFGRYTCTVQNTLGKDSFTISLQMKACEGLEDKTSSYICSVAERIPMLVTLAGIIGGIVLIISITCIVVICLRRSSENKKDQNQQCNWNKHLPPNDHCCDESDLKAEVKTVSSISTSEHEKNWSSKTPTDQPERVTDHFVMDDKEIFHSFKLSPVKDQRRMDHNQDGGKPLPNPNRPEVLMSPMFGTSYPGYYTELVSCSQNSTGRNYLQSTFFLNKTLDTHV
ncbi:irregular chiasm C-roughest protein-like isoform X2 [Tachypleus tridentatus]|uniref:irregular chiasm C-roughest protein-like isoform X2 n=1 Tax=Tachypleus tridentatus TaxID=6853 RepID=UPI003FD2E7D9